jgi:two-component system response regulator NreC
MPRINSPKKELLQFRALPQQVELLEELVKLTGQSQSEHLRQAVVEYLQSPPIRRLLGSKAPAYEAMAAEAARLGPDEGKESLALRILIVENQTLVRELLSVACEHVLPEATIETAGSGADALAACRREPPQLMMLDLVLSDGDGLDRLGEFFAIVPDLKVIALSSHIDEFTVHRALKARVDGIVDKNEQPMKALGEAISAVMSGRQYISAGVQRLRSATRADPTSVDKVLSDREQEVLRLIGDGLTNEQIAEKLGLSVTTARNHRLNIMASLDIHSAPQLIRYALEKGFSHTPEGVARRPRA